MIKKIKIEKITKNPLINIAIDTIKKEKQAIFFVSTKSSAEKLAKEISEKFEKLELITPNERIFNEITNVINPPTTQCLNLANTSKFLVSFHHSGLLQKQRETIENEFRNGVIKIICATPTLAAGVDLPAYRVIIKDLKRFSEKMDYIKVLEYKQMAGRAGRFGMEDVGEALIYIKENDDENKIISKFIYGTNEEIYSKLSVEPILRKTILGLISTYFRDYDKLIEFFKKSFYAYQFSDFEILKEKIDKIITDLKNLNFLENDNTSKKQESLLFVNASNLINQSKNILRPTQLGIRVSQLYLEPYSAKELILGLSQLNQSNEFNDKTLINFMKNITNCIELKPLFSVLKNESTKISDFNFEQDIDFYSLEKAKLIYVLLKWLNEETQEEILLNHNVTPGLLKAKLDILDWLIHSSLELSKIIYPDNLILHNNINSLEIRMKYGIKQELKELVEIKGIGKIRARMLYNNNIKSYSDIIEKKELTSKIIGEKLTEKIIQKTI